MAYIFAVAVYLAVSVPSLRTIVTPVDVDTRADRIEALRILSAGNTIIMVVLGAVLVLQVIIPLPSCDSCFPARRSTTLIFFQLGLKNFYL